MPPASWVWIRKPHSISLEFIGPPTPEIAHITATWIELLLHGVYTCLFFEGGYIMLRKRKKDITPSRIFFATTCLMYIISTTDICLNIHRSLRVYAWHEDLPAVFYTDVRRWETIAHTSIWCTMTWLGDMLVIYRCWIIWNHNYWIIVLPVILLIFSIVSSVMCLVWFTHFDMVTIHAIESWMAPIYPLALAQNVITTGLITFKIWTQHRISVTSHVVDTSSRLNLGKVLRIIIESAAIYTIQILILVILTPMRYNAHHIVQAAIIPSIGIVFALIAVRVHLSNSTTFFDSETPSWFGDPDSFRGVPRAAGSGSTMTNIGSLRGECFGINLTTFSQDNDPVVVTLNRT